MMAKWGQHILRFFERTEKTKLKLRKAKAATDDIYASKPEWDEYEIEGVVVPSTTRELFYRAPGTLEDGTLRIFVKPEYDIDGTKVKVETGDRIKVGDLWGEVLAVVDYIVPETGILLKECTVR